VRRCETRFLQCGCCRHPEAATLRGGRLSPIVFPALAGLFLHSVEGPVLFDTGYDPAFLQASEPFPERLYRWVTPLETSRETSAAGHLARLGLNPTDVHWVVLSHFHGDHVAGLHAFPKARIVAARAGLASARRRGVWGGALPRLIPADLEARMVAFEDCERTALPAAFAPFTDGADLFGDGSLLAVELPGHCPGHWGLAARGEDDRLHLLCGDAAWSSQAIRENRPPPAFTTALLGRTGPYRATLARLHALSVSAPEVLITPSHCAERAADIRAAR
jgi:glyoxylase-like metal-dependent hydrolase (beta-lactamase superfamily II)